jgi:hypothetical protein
MIDIYFIQSILNIIWYIFSILFVLYKFTSFFSYIWNFIKFLGKFTKGVVYVSEQVKIFLSKRQSQQTELPIFINRGIDIRNEEPRPNQNFFTSSKKKINEFIFGKSTRNNYIPLTDTRLSYINSDIINSDMTRSDIINSDIIHPEITKNTLEKSSFDKHIDSTMQSNYSDVSDMDGFKSIKIDSSSYSSFYPPPQIIDDPDLTENAFANEKGNTPINSNIFFESTFIKKWMNQNG